MTVWALYSEIDPFAAAWLTKLIGAGHIMPGVVDTRSLEDLTPDECNEFRQVHLCAGIGVWSHALRMAGWEDHRPCWTASFPCQPFSAAGKGAAFADERHIWPSGHWLIDQCRPPIVFGEQVASKDGLAWLDVVSADLEGSGYAFGAADLCAAGVGAPHIRQRSYWVANGDHAERRAGAAGRHDGHRADAGWPQGTGDVEGRRGVIGLDDTASARHIGPIGDAESDPRHEARLRVSGSGREDGGLGTAGADSGVFFGRGHQAEGGRIGAAGSIAATGQPCGLDDANGGDACAERQQCGGQQRQQPSNGGAVGSLADAHNQGLEGRREPGCERADQFPAGPASLDGGMADPDDAKRRADSAGWNDSNRADSGWAQGSSDAERCSSDDRPGPTNGFWSDADWLYCRDGRWRPVEPGTFPLVARPAEGMVRGSNSSRPINANSSAEGRVGRLRGYGNALCLPVAETFIASVMESLP